MAWAAARRIAACSTAEMITLITAVTMRPPIRKPKLRSTTSTGCPKTIVVCFDPSKTTPEKSELMNVSGTTTIATMRMRLAAFAL